MRLGFGHSQNPPPFHSPGIFITNAASVNLTIDSITASEFPNTLTISNLTILVPPSDSDTLYLDNTGTIALHILDGLNIGFNPNGLGVGASTVVSSNSTLIVDGLMNGQLVDDGTLIIIGGSLITTNCGLQVGASVGCCIPSPSGLFIIASNAVVEAGGVAIAADNNSNGYIELIGGTMTLSASLTVGNADNSGRSEYACGKRRMAYCYKW